MKPSKCTSTVFVNKAAFAFNRLVDHKAILGERPGAYRITDHGRNVLKRCPNDAEFLSDFLSAESDSSAVPWY